MALLPSEITVRLIIPTAHPLLTCSISLGGETGVGGLDDQALPGLCCSFVRQLYGWRDFALEPKNDRTKNHEKDCLK